MRPVYVTTPIYYINAEPHIGHTYTTVVTDTVARFWRDRGHPTFFLTGTDEHGEKIMQAAAAAGVSPKGLADRVSAIFRETWDASGIAYDHFIRTTDAYHRTVVEEFLTTLHRNGDIYFGNYRGLYCTGCERLLTEKELVNGLCPDHQIPPTPVDEPNYFFRMSAYQARLIAHIEQHPAFIVPTRFRNEVLAMLRGEALGDLCISRPRTRLPWGIELPFDTNYVAYVWVDALVNYVSALKVRGDEQFTTYWPHAEHIIGKDILKAHSVFWPTLLMGAGLPLFRRLHVHGYWTRGASKMSKSLGNVIRPLDMKARFGMDAFRYFLLREMAFGQDATFSEDAFITRINADLANNLGNLVSRTLSMQQRYFDGIVQPIVGAAAEDRELEAAFATACEDVPTFVEQMAFHRALEALWRAIDQANKYIVVTSPFTLAKDPAQRPRVGTVLHHLLEGLYVIGVTLRPFMPETAARLLTLLNLPPTASLAPPWRWGSAVPEGHATAKPVILFPRIEADPPS